MKKKTYLRRCDIYIRLACRSRGILKLLECRGGSEGSTEDHYSIRALARYRYRWMILVDPVMLYPLW